MSNWDGICAFPTSAGQSCFEQFESYRRWAGNHPRCPLPSPSHQQMLSGQLLPSEQAASWLAIWRNPGEVRPAADRDVFWIDRARAREGKSPACALGTEQTVRPHAGRLWTTGRAEHVEEAEPWQKSPRPKTE